MKEGADGNLRRAKRIAIVVSENLLAQQFFKVHFLLFLTFDMYCNAWERKFVWQKDVFLSLTIKSIDQNLDLYAMMVKA